MTDFIRSTTLLLALLNPFLIVVYLVDVIEKLKPRDFSRVLIQVGLITNVVFLSFAILGDAIFSSIIQAEFASFQIFGGIVFLLIGIQFVFQGPTAIGILRGESDYIAGAIAMPVLIGPGTISVSVVIGKRHTPLVACLAILIAVTVCLVTVAVLKLLHDILRPRREALIQRYIEVAGRITALFVETVAVEMIMQGLKTWMAKF